MSEPKQEKRLALRQAYSDLREVEKNKIRQTPGYKQAKEKLAAWRLRQDTWIREARVAIKNMWKSIRGGEPRLPREHQPTALSTAIMDSAAPLITDTRRVVVGKMREKINKGRLTLRSTRKFEAPDSKYLAGRAPVEADSLEHHVLALVELFAGDALAFEERMLLWELLEAIRDDEAVMWIELLKPGPRTKKEERAELAAKVGAKNQEFEDLGYPYRKRLNLLKREFGGEDTKINDLIREHRQREELRE